jgi:hypothetical protein
MTRQDVATELWQRRHLVKTYGIRGTIHLFPADELSMWLAALRASTQPERRKRQQEGELDADQTKSVVQAIAEALDGHCLTRAELGREVADRVGDWVLEEAYPAWGGSWPRWWTAIGAAALRGVACFGPNQGNRVTFVRPSQWLGPQSQVSGEHALREVVRRYLTAFGPATAEEFAQWFSMAPRSAKALFRSLAGELEEVDVQGDRRWARGVDLSHAWVPIRDSLRLVPRFDCFVVGGFPRDRLIPPDRVERASARGMTTTWTQSSRSLLAGPTPVLLANGSVAGVWEYKRQGRRLEVAVEPLVRLSARNERRLHAEAARIGAILGLEASLVLREVRTRPHL